MENVFASIYLTFKMSHNVTLCMSTQTSMCIEQTALHPCLSAANGRQSPAAF